MHNLRHHWKRQYFILLRIGTKRKLGTLVATRQDDKIDSWFMRFFGLFLVSVFCQSRMIFYFFAQMVCFFVSDLLLIFFSIWLLFIIIQQTHVKTKHRAISFKKFIVTIKL